MCQHISTIGIGILFIIGGLSGSLVLRGTNNSIILAVIGLVLVIYGIWRIATMSKVVRATQASTPASPVPITSSIVSNPTVDPKPAVPYTAPPPAPKVNAIELPDASNLPTNEKALLLLKVLVNRKKELVKDANSVTVEAIDRYLKNFPVNEAEMQKILQSLQLRKSKLSDQQADPSKISEVEYWLKLMREFDAMRFNRSVKRSTIQ